MFRDVGDPQPVPEAFAVIGVLADDDLFDAPFQYGAVVRRQPVGVAVAVALLSPAIRPPAQEAALPSGYSSASSAANSCRVSASMGGAGARTVAVRSIPRWRRISLWTA